MPEPQHKLNARLTQKFEAVLSEIERRDDEDARREFWEIWRTVNTAGGRLGIPRDETPAIMSGGEMVLR